ncbi:MAG: phospho-sugar mutase [Myxococcota bacterium]
MDEQIQRWLERDPDPATRKELGELVARNDTAEIAQRFRGRLEFGTAGLRGVLGAGPMCMNRLVVRETTAGLGSYLQEQIEDARKRGVVIGYDGRHGSKTFAEDAAAVLAALGLRVHLYDRLVPTPLVAFAVRKLGAAAGVMVTASHNPPAYNGYKVYWQHGAQIIAPHDRGIASAIVLAAETEIPWLNPDEARRRGLIEALGDAMIEAYLDGVASLSIHKKGKRRAGMRIAYTPLHGVGAVIAERALAQAGFASVHTVASQREPDGDFPTVSFPNPEEPGAMDAVLALAREVDAVLAVANDPDADRLCAAVRRAPGDYRVLTGDQLGVLLGADRLAKAPRRAVVASTIVSSRLLGVIAAAEGVAYEETLTGLKWIAEAGFRREARGDRFLFGYEEALGYAIGGLVRDKAGISALVALCELAAHCANRGETLLDRLEAIYRRHGLYLTAQRSIPLPPDTEAPGIGAKLRMSTPKMIAGRRVAAVTDVIASERTYADGRTEALTLPKSDVLVYLLEDDARVVVRPSGTEPKVKCYYEVHEHVAESEQLKVACARAETSLAQLILQHQRELTG